MLIPADYKFLTLQRLQKAQEKSQIPSDISEISSEAELEDEHEIHENHESEIEEIEEIGENTDLQTEIKKIEVCETEPILVKEENIQKETNSVVIPIQNKQEQALELLKSAFDKIKLALSMLDEQKTDASKLNQEIEKISQSITPITEESIAPVMEESVAPVMEESIAPVMEESVAPVMEESVAPVMEESVSSEVAEIVTPKVAESVSSEVAEIVTPKAAKAIPTKISEVVAPKASKTDVPKIKKTVTPKAFEKNIVSKEPETVAFNESETKATIKKEAKEEFKVVMPKKSKNKTSSIVVPNGSNIEVEKPDDFPVLGGSFSPVQKTGFWNSGKNSLEIAKSIASIPSPPPTRSPTLTKSIKGRAGSRGPIEEVDCEYDDNYKYRKNGSDDDGDTYWQ